LDTAVSIVVPAYNEERRLGDSLPRLVSWLAHNPEAELILVDDGSEDRTHDVARELLLGEPGASVLRLPWHSGKGAAVKLGISVARGDAVVFMDADLATDLADLPKLVHALERADVIIGSRNHGKSFVSGRTLTRSALNKAFALYARRVAGVEASDSQCGFKALRSPVAKLLASQARLNGLAFDVEILVLARKLGFRVVEVPVRWRDVTGGSVSVFRDSTSMLVDVMRVRADRRAVPPLNPFEVASGRAAYRHARPRHPLDAALGESPPVSKNGAGVRSSLPLG
jgi:dolichyl-phosphate beta-glucosyltransferase